MVTAGVIAVVVVVVTMCVGIVVELACKEHRNGAVGIPLHTAVNADARFSERRFGTTADAAADENAHTAVSKECR